MDTTKLRPIDPLYFEFLVEQGVSWFYTSGRMGNGICLNAMDLRKMPFASKQLCKAQIVNCCMDYVNANKADFYNAVFKNVSCFAMQAQNALFDRASFKSVDFTDASLPEVAFRGAHFINVKFNRADLRNADFRYAKLENVDFSDADLTGATFEFAT
jgi:uncharacterized protein YjbI with pentapeptide repeats